MNDIKEKLEYGIKQWSLIEANEIYALDTKAVYRAKSEQYGNVILKINQDMAALASEYHMLRTMNGVGACQVFEYDNEKGMLLEERIIPGTVLREESDVTIRIKEFIKVFKQIHHISANDMNYPTYLDWLDTTCTNMQRISNADLLKEKIISARNIGYNLFRKYPERMLLHGDLHHDNMLRTCNGEYVIIDPKGVIGPPIFDIPRFIMNELEYKNEKAKIEHILYIIDKIAEYLTYPAADIRKLFFMEVILGNSWLFEDGEEPVNYDIDMAAEILALD